MKAVDATMLCGGMHVTVPLSGVAGVCMKVIRKRVRSVSD